jgi:hypothetical protein
MCSWLADGSLRTLKLAAIRAECQHENLTLLRISDDLTNEIAMAARTIRHYSIPHSRIAV